MTEQSEFPPQYPLLRLLDDSTRCPICQSIIATPLVLRTCGHSFCAACIRKNLEFQERGGEPSCPSCRSPCDARDLTPNVTLRQMTEKYSEARIQLLCLISQHSAALERKNSRFRRSKRIKDLTPQAKEGEEDSEIEISEDGPDTNFSVDLMSDEEWNSESELEPNIPPPIKKQKQQPQNNGAPKSFLRCPICRKHVPDFYINSHVDQCLNNPQAAELRTHTQQAEAGPSRQHHAHFVPLVVPPKLVPTLVSEKSLRQMLRKYDVSAEGKKPELLEKYNKLRIEVELANDRQEKTTYSRLAKNMLMRKQVPGVNPIPPPPPRKFPGEVAAMEDPTCQKSDGAFIGYSFEELIEATRKRDAARKAARLCPEKH